MGFHRLIGVLAGALILACDAAPKAPPAEREPAAEIALLLGAYRPDDGQSEDLFRFEPGYDVESFDGEAVRVHFTRTGPDAVRAADEDGSGVPDAVEQVAASYDEVLAFYAGLGFRPPVTDLGTSDGDGGDGRLDVYLIDFAGASDGAWVRERCEATHPRCSGHVVQENDFAGYGYPSYRTATRILASHELFHAVQAAYDANQGANWSEATAVWASERFDPSLSDLEHFADGWLDKPDRSIDQEPIGPVDSYSYGLGIFAQFLYERFDDAVHLQLWEAVEDGAGGVADPHWLAALTELLAKDFDTSFEAEWVTFITWALRAGWGDAGGPTFANARALPEMARDEVSLPFSDDKLRVYPTSAQAWSVSGAEVAVAIVSTEAGDTDGLVLVTGARKGNALTTRVRDGLEAAMDGSGNDEVIVAVVNTNLEGNSKRPGLCLGTIAEVEACKSALAPVAEPAPEEVAESGPEAAEEAPEAEELPEVVEEAAVAEPAPGGGDEGCDDGGASFGGLFGLAWAVLRSRGNRA
jgi:hypothetical protein